MNGRMLKTAVITGPTGAIGRALVSKLRENSVRIYMVCRPGSARSAELPTDKDTLKIECDVSQLNRLPSLITEHIDVFFHLAWSHTTGAGRNDMAAQIRNIDYTISAVQAAKQLGCSVFIGAGSQAEYGRVEGILKPDTPCFPENGYGMAKLCAGQMSRTECAGLGMVHIWPRILSVYGPYDGAAAMIPNTIRKLLNGETPQLTQGIQLWDYLYSGDAAEAIYRMAVFGKDGSIYPLGSGRAKQLREFLITMRDSIDSKLQLGFGEIPYSAQQVMFLQADISALKQDTGFEPATDFADGIKTTIEWIKETM